MNNEYEFIDAISHNLKKAIEFISRGKVTIKISSNSIGFSCSKKDLDALETICDPRKELNLPVIFDRFGWDYEKDSEKITGEGVIAYWIFQWLMSDKELSKLDKSFFKNLRLREGGKNDL